MMGEDSEYCLRWHRHLHNFVESFETLLENEALADVYFFAEGQLVKAHKVVLSSCSTYFQSLFKETIERHPIIVLKDFKLAHIKALLQFMYRGTVNVPRESLEPIMKMAETLNIKGLADGVVDVEKVEHEDNTPMSLIHPNISNNHYIPPQPSAPDTKASNVGRPPLSHLYNTPATSVHSVLSTALTMPSALSLTSPLTLPHLAGLSSNLASSLASTLSNAIPQSIASFISPRDIPDGSESPLQKRRRKQRRRSGETIDSGDSDGRSSGSPGDSVPNLHLPRIPATITPIGLHRQPQPPYPQNSSHSQQQQPRDLSIHSSQNHSGNAHDVRLERSSSLESPHRDRFHGIKPPPPNLPGLLLHPPIENHHKPPPQEEPENLERRPSSHPLPMSFKHEPHDRPAHKPDSSAAVPDDVPPNQQSESPHVDKNSPPTSSRLNDEDRMGATRQSPKCAGSEPESLRSPSKGTSGGSRLDETSSDNNHESEDEREDDTNGHRDPKNDRLSDSMPGPSTPRPQSQEAPQTTSFLGWPYSNEANSSEESFANLSGESSQDYFRALNLVRARFSGILPPRVSSELYSHPSTVPLGIPLLLKGEREKGPSKNLLGYPFPETPKQFTCDKCGRSYASTGNLKRHKKYECGVEPQFSCPICKKKFQHRHSVKIHVFSTHRNESGESVVDATREGPPIFSTPDVSSVGTPSWPIPQDASSGGAQNQEG